MTERDIPDSWSPNKGRPQDETTRLSRNQQFIETNGSDISGTSSQSKSVKQPQVSNSQKLDLQKQTTATGMAGKKSGKLPGFLKSWVLWGTLIALVPGTIGFMAMAILFKLPSAPNCPAIFWPLASASVRVHCAQVAASKQTTNDLLQAIALVQQLPANHPLRPEIDRMLEEWSMEILKIAEIGFQDGKLDQAIASAHKIPKDLPAYAKVEEKIAKWRSTWAKAEGIYRESEDEIREAHWHDAFMAASRLLRVDNKFWETTKYQQLNNLITKTREDGDKLAKAEGLAKNNSVDDLVAAIKLTESITADSYLYQKAQEAIPLFGRQMLEIAERKLNKRDADEAISIAQQIPANAGLQGETEDFIAIADAQRNAWVGTVSGLEAGIAQAQQINSNRAVYPKAQQLIASWQLEIQDVGRLEKARLLATQGTVPDLTSAIAEAQLVPVGNPRSREARQEINRWASQVQTIEDRPLLDRADQLALLQDPGSLQAAIAEASRVRRGRALYSEAREKIATWTGSIQRVQDQPYLDRARELASSGNLSGAVEVANQITGNRALSREAEAAIGDWQGQLNARANWKKAREVALKGTPDALAEAIRLANKIPENSGFHADANTAADQWSQQILDIARSQSDSDLPRAMETVRLIPRGTAAYSSAREQIRAWRELLQPAPEPKATEEAQPTPEAQ
jgi:hypothetical protein